MSECIGKQQFLFCFIQQMTLALFDGRDLDPDSVPLSAYREMFTMSSNQRQRYYVHLVKCDGVAKHQAVIISY